MPTPEKTSPRLRRALAVAQPVTKAEKSRAIQAAHRPEKPKTTIAIRRAVVTDAVNIYKQWLTDDVARNDKTEFDPAARVAYVVTTIATGFVLVVEVSGRILGSIGFANGGHGFNKKPTLVSVWNFLLPNLRRPEVVGNIVTQVTRFADQFNVDIEVTLDNPEIAALWADFDFVPKGAQYLRKADGIGEPAAPEEEPEEEIPPAPSSTRRVTAQSDDPEDFEDFDANSVGADPEDDDADDPLSKRKDLPPAEQPEPEDDPDDEFSDFDYKE